MRRCYSSPGVETRAAPAARQAEGGDRPRSASWLERGVALLLVLASLPYLARFLHVMATTSLWTDEIFSILVFSGPGPANAATTYFEANNHVFFNVLNACLPWRGTMDPLAARAISFAATLALLAGLAAFLARRAGLVVGSAAFLLFATNREFLDLALQARGYGLASLLALLLAVLGVRAVEGAGPGVLAALALVAVLGTWTLPTFAFLAAPLLLLLFAFRRDRASFLTGLAALAGVALVHLPVARLMLESARDYGARWGYQYGTWRAVGESIRIYLLRQRWPLTDAVAVALLLALAAAALARRREPEAASRVRGPRLLVLSALAFFAICLSMRTPLIRSTCFVGVPLAVAGGLLAGPAWTRWRHGPLVAAALSVPLVAYASRAAAAFEYLPQERWRELGRLVADALPPGARLHVAFHPDYLARYLPEGLDPTASFDAARFASGELAVVDSPALGAGPRIGERIAPGSAAFLVFPQRLEAFIGVHLAPPRDAHLVRVVAAGGVDVTEALRDRRLDASEAGGAGAPLRVELVEGRRYRSLVLAWAGRSPGGEIEPVLILTGHPGAQRPGPVHVSGGGIVVNLRDLPVRAVLLAPAPGSSFPPLAEVWAYALAGSPR